MKMEEDQMRIDRIAKQKACKHPTKKLYSLTATKYFLCLDCGEQFPMEEEE
tara:strand:- start:44 stop:196 length:153 start_codon:yes stop_codon:yes gene_type:complete